MKNTNIEDQLRERLGSRTIAPSGDAWERLAHNRQQSKKGKKKFGVYFIAASVAFLLLGGYVVFMYLNTAVVTVAPGVVNAPSKQEVVHPVKVIAPGVEETIALSIPETEHNVASPIKNNPANTPDVAGERTAAYAVEVTKNDVGGTNASALASAKAINIPKLTNTNDIYEAQAAMLLQQAANDIALQRQRAKATNDTALLKEVESEMNDYYRDKAMRFFVLKHKTIRFAVRDQQ